MTPEERDRLKTLCEENARTAEAFRASLKDFFAGPGTPGYAEYLRLCGTLDRLRAEIDELAKKGA